MLHRESFISQVKKNLSVPSIDKIKKVTQIFKDTKADVDNLKLVKNYTSLALNSLNDLSISIEKKEELIEFSNSLLDRKL